MTDKNDASANLQMFYLLRAFSDDVWIMTVAGVLTTTIVMLTLEGRHGRSSFAEFSKKGLWAQIEHGLYLSMLGLSEHDFFTAGAPITLQRLATWRIALI